MEAAGLKFPLAVLREIRARIENDKELGRTELSREVCRWLGWRTPKGRLREMACRLALLELERREQITLPPRRSTPRRTMPAAKWEGIEDRAIRCELHDLGEIRLVAVTAAEPGLSAFWNEAIAGYHYLGYTPLVGAQRRYLIHSENYGCLGALGFSAAARRLAVRDRWIGWDDAARAERLQWVVCNSRFLILPWVQVRNLASRVLALAARQVCQDWPRLYGYRPVLLETFVDPQRFAGTCYRAANWIDLGRSRGRGRQDGEHGAQLGAKQVLVYPLCADLRRRLCGDRQLHGATRQNDGTPQDWAEQECGRAPLADERLKRRFVSIVRDFYSRPQANIPGACNGDRARTKAVYRFLDNEEVTLAKLIEPHRQHTLERMGKEAVVLAVQDTTSLNYSAHLHTEGLGPIGTNSSGAQGIIVHDTLAITPQGLALGVLDAQVWTRDGEHKGDQRPIEQKESAKWLRSYQAAARAQAELKHTRIVSVGDREADLYELFALAAEHRQAGGPEILVRAREDRRLLGEDGKCLWERVEAEPVAGYREVVVPPRPGRRARTAELTVRFCPIELKAPQGKGNLGPQRLWAVHARERRAPTGAAALEWMLLTSLEVNDFEQACEKLDWYVQRWMIEVYHRTLKSGCRIEHRQLATERRLENCLAIDMVVAARIMHLTWLGRTCPDVPCTIYFEDQQWKALYCFHKRTRTPQAKTPSIRDVIGWIARLGGYLGRNSDRPPGTQVLWEGLQRADDIVETVKIFTNFGQGP